MQGTTFLGKNAIVTKIKLNGLYEPLKSDLKAIYSLQNLIIYKKIVIILITSTISNYLERSFLFNST